MRFRGYTFKKGVTSKTGVTSKNRTLAKSLKPPPPYRIF